MWLYHDDCLNIMNKLIAEGIKVDAIIADPPYQILNKKCGWDNVIPIEIMWKLLLKIRKNKTTPMVLFSQEPFTSKLIIDKQKLFKYKWYWQKTQSTGFLNAKKQPLRNIEEILVFYEKQSTYNSQKTYDHKPINSYTKKANVINKSVVYGNVTKTVSGGGETSRYPTQLLTYKSDKQTNYLHPTQKPLALLEYLVKTYTNEGDVVLDFCMGSGTTGMACKNLNRHFIGIEKEEKYFNISKNRLKLDK